jgi:hypothetical protein
VLIVASTALCSLSSIIFYVLDPARTVIHAPVPPAVVHNSTIPLATPPNGTATAVGAAVDLVSLLTARQEGGAAGEGANTTAVGFIFRCVLYRISGQRIVWLTPSLFASLV